MIIPLPTDTESNLPPGTRKFENLKTRKQNRNQEVWKFENLVPNKESNQEPNQEPNQELEVYPRATG